MEKKKFIVAAANMDCTLGVVSENLKKMEAICKEASIKGAQAICFPELATTGYSPVLIGEKYYEISEQIPGPSTDFLCEVAKATGLYIVTGISEKSSVPGKLYNSQVAISPEGEIVSVYRKIHVWGLEKLYWKESTTCEFATFEMPMCKAGTMICYDTSFPETARVLGLMGVNMIFDSAAWRIQEADIWELNTRARAVENHVYMVCANRCGVEGDSTLNGESRIIGPRGNVLAVAGREEEVIYAEVDIDSCIRDNAMLLSYMKDRRPEAYGLITERSNY
ncbi:MAG: nitrilase-related carbon-nitrogen hydrolase [Candidatus Metalachnospira sp.]|nr:nitrilase-related carbon-nitrogen hydrolase [Candidatus Metalachnospira sp.]